MLWIHDFNTHGHCKLALHYNDVTMTATASLITRLKIDYSTVYSSADQRKHQSSASLAFVRGIHRGPVNSPHKWPVTRKMFPFDDVIMTSMFIYAQTISLIRADASPAVKVKSTRNREWNDSSNDLIQFWYITTNSVEYFLRDNYPIHSTR